MCHDTLTGRDRLAARADPDGLAAVLRRGPGDATRELTWGSARVVRLRPLAHRPAQDGPPRASRTRRVTGPDEGV